jgi:hypothetical protein
MRLTVLALGLLALGVLACKGGGGGERAADRFGAALEEAAPMFATLAAVRGAVPAAGTFQAKPCPVGEFGAAAGNPFLLPLTWNDLVEATGEEELRTTVDSELAVFSTFSDNRVARLEGPRAELWEYPDPGGVQEAFERFRRFKYAAVVYPTVVRGPTHIGDSFEPGRAEAWVLIFRLADAALLCAAPVSAENDDSIDYSYQAGASGAQEGKRTLAIKDNLQTRLREAIDAVLATLTGAAR